MFTQLMQKLPSVESVETLSLGAMRKLAAGLAQPPFVTVTILVRVMHWDGTDASNGSPHLSNPQRL
ncbi:hypothetical protein [Phyllobacterium sp. P5_D12]